MAPELKAASRPSARSVIEEMGDGTEVIARFQARGATTRRIEKATRERPVYRNRRFDLSDGMGAFLGGLPLMTKTELRQHFPQGFLPPGDSFAELIETEDVIVVRTSGTSSDRLQVLWDWGWWEDQEYAALARHPFIGPRVGRRYREAVLTTPLCSENVCHSGPVPMEDRRLGNLLFLNTQHDPTRWTTADFERMIDELRRFRPTAIEADPVYLAALATYLRDSGAPVPAPKWIVLSYELVGGLEKALIAEVFGCPVFECYGLTEAGVFFLECPAGRHHFVAQHAVVEVLRPQGVPLPPGCGEIIVTTWGNDAQPLLRYRTDDLVTVRKGRCACGMPGKALERFEGRVRDVLELPDGRLLTPRQIDVALAEVAGLARYQCAQEGHNELRVRYLGSGSAATEAGIVERLEPLLPGLEIRVERVPFIAPEPSGKYRTVVPS